MKRKILIFFLILLFLVFMAGIAAAIFAGPVSTRFLHGEHKSYVTYGGMGVAFVTSTILIKQQLVRAFLASRPVLWFLFLFNAAVAVGLYFVLAGPKGIAAAAGMGLVSLGAGTGLLRSPKKG